MGADTRLLTSPGGVDLTAEEADWREKGRGQAESLFRSLSEFHMRGRACP